MPFGLLGAAFGIGQSIAGLGARRNAQQVTDVQNAFDARVAGINARRVERDNLSTLALQRSQVAATGNTLYGSLLLTAADDARRARERVTGVYLDNANRALGRQANLPSQAGATANLVGNVVDFGTRLNSLGLLRFGG